MAVNKTKYCRGTPVSEILEAKKYLCFYLITGQSSGILILQVSESHTHGS